MAWVIDASHSQITFSVRHMMISNARGRFESFSGAVDFNEQDPAKSTVNVQIDAASVNTKDEKRDGHLKSADFFDVEKYPHLTFVSKQAQKTSDTTGRILGDLTLHGVTKEVALEVEYNGQSKSPWGTISAGFTATAKVNRKDFGLNWNVALETGGLLVGDDVKIEIELEIVKQPEAQAAAAA